MSWKGSRMASLPCLTVSNTNAPPVAEAPNHAVLVSLPLPPEGEDPKPHPAEGQDIWDDSHVLMPNSAYSLHPNLKNGPGEPRMIPRWPIICSAYKKPIRTSDDLCHAILKYNRGKKWSLIGLKSLLNKAMNEEERDDFFNGTLPGIVSLALSLPDTVTTPPPLLKKATNASITMSQKQVACLMANAFLCTFPERDGKGRGAACLQSHSYPTINFSDLFNYANPKTYEKLRCIIHYFKEVVKNGHDGLVTFCRQYVPPDATPNFQESRKLLSKLHIASKGVIEDADGLLQMDFADPYIGGLVFTIGLVQEEIRFVLSPELIITRLFTEIIEDRDSFLIIGAERYSKGTGYARNFKWVCPHTDETPRDEFRRKLVQVVALDATRYRSTLLQYREESILRELVKAYTGFRVLDGSCGVPVAVATGNWGCGIFRGNPYLKSLIQMAAAAEAGRDVAYFTFKDEEMKERIHSIHEFLTTNEVTVGQLLEILYEYGNTREGADGKDLYPYIRSKVESGKNRSLCS